HAQSWVASFDPARNANDVPDSTLIRLTFTQDIDTSTLRHGIQVYGMESGYVPATSIGWDSGTKTAFYVLSKRLRVGEEVSVSVTTEVKNVSQQAMPEPFVWEFRIQPRGGSGNFTEISNAAVPGSAWQIQAGDFDGDGDLDLASVNGTAGSITLFRNNGSGVITVWNTITSADNPESLWIGDYNQDGDMDIAVADNGNDAFSLFHNNGSGGFGPPVILNAGADPHGIRAFDKNGDGFQDILVSNFAANTMSYFENVSAASWNLSGTPISGTGAEQAIVGDWDEDGDLDVAIPEFISATTRILTSNTPTDLTLVTTLNTLSGSHLGTAGDLDNDGHKDIVVPSTSADQVNLIFGNGMNVFTDSVFAVGGGPGHIALGDWDNDADLDMAVGLYNATAVRLYENLGDGNFMLHGSLTSLNAYSSVFGDFTGDGKLDLAVLARAEGLVRIFANDHLVGNGVATQLAGKLEVGPQPAASQVTVRFGLAAESPLWLEVRDLTGRLVVERDLGWVAAGERRVDLNVSGWATGQYVVRLRGAAIAPAKFVVER
ncbi:MAG: FG-GAP-like repeat-containing protein, partial [Bacteroidota bacterium]